VACSVRVVRRIKSSSGVWGDTAKGSRRNVSISGEFSLKGKSVDDETAIFDREIVSVLKQPSWVCR
jgi:hypothetical protein